MEWQQQQQEKTAGMVVIMVAVAETLGVPVLELWVVKRTVEVVDLVVVGWRNGSAGGVSMEGVMYPPLLACRVMWLRL